MKHLQMTVDCDAPSSLAHRPLPALGAHGVAVATAFPAATATAARLLAAGGNAVDAAIGAAWALAVCEPSGSGLGGQTTMLVYFPNGDTVVLDGHSYAPQAASRARVSRTAQRTGPAATTVPSTPATLGEAHEHYGRLARSAVMEPAIALAADGFPVTKLLRRHIRWCQAALAAQEFTNERFLRNGRPLRRGEILRQPELARTLERLAAQGTADFYRGETARFIVQDMIEQGGLITAADLHDCALPTRHAPLAASYRGYEVVSVGPPAGGLQLLLGLKVLDRLMLPCDPEPAVWFDAISRVTRAVFLERDRLPIDPRAVSQSQLRWMASDERAAEIAAEIRAGRDHPGPLRPDGPGDTTHLCVRDASGMVVSLTQSVQSLFGAKLANPYLGFFYNNYLCTCPRYRHPNRLGGGAIPQSNAAPTLVLESIPGRPGVKTPILSLGAAGSRRITSSLLQVMANVLHRGMPLAAAIAAPRVHASSSGRVMLERRAATPEVEAILGRSFQRIELKAAQSYAMGGVQAIARGSDGIWIGAADPRREGTAHVD